MKTIHDTGVRLYVLPAPAGHSQRESCITHVIPVHTNDDRRLTPMTTYDHADHIRAIVGDGLISESMVQRQARLRREMRQRLIGWTIAAAVSAALWVLIFNAARWAMGAL